MSEEIRRYNGNKAPKVETMSEGVEYAITINFRKQPDSLNICHLAPYIVKHRDMFTLIIIKNALILWPEVSPVGRLHFHGVYCLKDMYEYIKFVRYLEAGLECSFEIDTIQDKIVWETYCKKQSFVFAEIFKNHLNVYPICVDGNTKHSKRLADLLKKIKRPAIGLERYDYILDSDSDSGSSSGEQGAG